MQVRVHKARVRRAEWCEASRFSNVHVHQAPAEEQQAAVRHMAGREKRVADHIQRALLERDTHRDRAWAERRDCRRQACRASRQEGREHQGDVRDSAISKGQKKVR